MALPQNPTPKTQPHRIGVDTGGTFTDLVLVDPAGTIAQTHKLLSTPDDPARAVLQGIDQLLAKADRPPRDQEPVDVVHGSTVATNALLEHAGHSNSRVAFVTTAGFEDTLRLARQHRPDLYALVPRRPDPPVPPECCIGVRERMRHDGTVIEALSDAEVDRVVEALAAMEIEAVAVSLLHSYANDAHERKLGAAIGQRFRGAVHLTLSSDLIPEFREYERASTCVVNAVVAPRMRRYLQRLADELGGDRLRIMASHGGTTTVADAVREPVRMILSGPAGGVCGAADEHEKRITLDMGGTSTDVALIDGEPTLSSEHEAGHLPVHLPMVDIHTVGAGGGSIAWLDPGGALRVGPQSAGADPGPACYGRAVPPGQARRVTVTDAHAYLGHLPDGTPLGDGLRIQRGLAVEAVERLAVQAGLLPGDLAQGVLRIAEVHIARAVQRISLQRGHDPRDATLVPFGGAGGLHACRLAEQLGMSRVRVPVHPGLLSAVGMLSAPLRYCATKSLHRVIPPGESEPDLTDLFGELDAMQPEADAPGLTASQITHEVAFRYAGQSHELSFTLDQAADHGHGGNLAAYFHEEHERLYGYADHGRAVELVLVRQWMDGITQELEQEGTQSPRASVSPHAPDTPRDGLIARDQLAAGTRLPGPVTVTEYSATTRVPEGWSLRVEADGTLLLEQSDG